MTTPADLYNMDPQYKDKNIHCLSGCYYNHIPEIEEWDWHRVQYDQNERVEIRHIKEFWFDHRRFWRLSTVWFDGLPVMIIQNAGREGDDFSESFITDKERYLKMVTYIMSLMTAEDKAEEDGRVVGLTEDLGDTLTSFYGDCLDGHFERHDY
jgi:hypothetical protein